MRIVHGRRRRRVLKLVKRGRRKTAGGTTRDDLRYRHGVQRPGEYLPFRSKHETGVQRLPEPAQRREVLVLGLTAEEMKTTYMMPAYIAASARIPCSMLLPDRMTTGRSFDR